MRKDHGPSFNMTTIKALLSLRTDLSKEEKNQVIRDSKEVLTQYKDNHEGKKTGIFNNIDTADAAKEFNEEMKDPEQPKQANELASEEEEMDLDDFLKQGGIEIDELDENFEATEIEKQNKAKRNKEKETDKVKKIVGRDNMNGWLFKSNDDLNEDKALFDTVLNTVTDTFHSVVDNINKKRTKRYFRIKKGHLYWYLKEDSDKAQNDLDIKKIEHLEI